MPSDEITRHPHISHVCDEDIYTIVTREPSMARRRTGRRRGADQDCQDCPLLRCTQLKGFDRVFSLVHEAHASKLTPGEPIPWSRSTCTRISDSPPRHHRGGDAAATQIGISPDCRCRSPLRVLGPQMSLYGRYEDDERRRTL
jgi:hypothetical protein